MIIKYILTVIVFCFSQIANAQPNPPALPNCWQGDVVVGNYLVLIDTQMTSKKDLINFLSGVNGLYINSNQFPIFYQNPSRLLVLIEPRLSIEDTLPTKIDVENEVSQLIDFNGVSSIECNGIVRPDNY